MCHSCGRSQVVPQGERHTYREMSCMRCGRLMRGWRHSLFCTDCRRGEGSNTRHLEAEVSDPRRHERVAQYEARAAAGLPLFEEVRP